MVLLWLSEGGQSVLCIWRGLLLDWGLQGLLLLSSAEKQQKSQHDQGIEIKYTKLQSRHVLAEMLFLSCMLIVTLVIPLISISNSAATVPDLRHKTQRHLNLSSLK